MLSIIVILSIIYLSTVSGSQLPPPPFAHVDKAVHLLLYFTLGVAFFIDTRHKKWQTIHKLLLCFFLCFIIGSSMEVIQHFLPYRSFSLWDMLANTIGSILALIMYLFWHKWLNH